MRLTEKPADLDGDENHSYAEISVSDDGMGIDETDIPKIFQPFKRLLGISDKRKTDGFGIGLHFVAHLVKEHKGLIRAEKNPAGGMTFTVIIPVSPEAFDSAEFKDTTNSNPALQPDGNPIDITAVPDHVHDPHLEEGKSDAADGSTDEADCDVEEDSRPKMLVIEDNVALNAFLHNIFCDKFAIIQAYDGQEGLQKAIEECPDIIISDVRMPGDTDGYALCHQLKTTSCTSHIPVILLTAKVLDENKIQGYNAGADAYLCKPFNPDVLIARVNNLIVKRSQQKTLIVATAGSSDLLPVENTAPAEELTPLDKKFLEKLYAYIDSSLDNCELNVNLLGRELGFSRTNFYRKVKALTGISPNDLLRVYRLNRAAELLLTREYTVGEVGERTGFGNQSHFSSLFKKHFGVSPRAYVTNRFAPAN